MFPLAHSLSAPSCQLSFQVLTLPYLCSGQHPLFQSSCCPGVNVAYCSRVTTMLSEVLVKRICILTFIQKRTL